MITAQEARALAKPAHVKNYESQLSTAYNCIEVASKEGKFSVEFKWLYPEVKKQLETDGFKIWNRQHDEIEIQW